jgi:hypothetical protein
VLYEWPTCDHLRYCFHSGHCKLAGCTRMYRYMIKLTITSCESVFSPCTSENERVWGNISTKETIEIFIQRSLRGLQHVEPTPISELWMALTKISNQSMVTAQWQFIIRLTENSNETKTHQWPSVPDYGQAHKTCSEVKLVLGT